ncbi:MAG: beta-CASP ribonuclease aCPSF1 [Nitrososphaera sp.]|uniref:beta-CASP ribonuclease aCPSF1 n=1 Tax=Nitrososphaera sp. TaxID=1971748 RepID=UPI003D6F0F2D
MHRRQPDKDSEGQNIMAVILQSLPKESGLTKIEYEGPKIALYSRNPAYLMQNNQLISNMVNTIKKRIVVRTDESIRKPQTESADIISNAISKEVGVAGTFFDPVLGEAVVFASKPWMLAQTGEEFDNIDLAEKTGWRVRIRKAPRSMAAIENMYRIMGETVAERTRFYREVGDKIFRDRLGDVAEASLTTLGGFAEVGRSCILLTTPESKVLLDCGINETAKDSLLGLPRFDVAGIGMDEIDAVVLTHAHLDHAGFIPALFKYGYAGPVYCTEPTLLLMSILQYDFVKRAKGLYADRDVEQAMVHTIPLTHGIVTDISPDVKLVLSNSGHILGSASAHLHIGNGDHNLVYTGDLKFGKTLALDNASWNFPRVETMVIESTYGGKEDIACPREEAEANLARSISAAAQTGGRVLIPVPAAGTAQELLLTLDYLMKSGRVPQVKVLVEKLVSEATAIYEAYPEFLSRELRSRISESEASPFGAQFTTVESQKVAQGEPAVILAPSSMLAGGPSVSYLQQIASDPTSKLILVSYQAPDTPGRMLQDGNRQVAIEGGTISVRCQVERIDGFSSHSDYNQLMAYVSRLRPKLRRVLVNHGERPKAQNLASSINKIFKIQTQHPLVQEAVKLL